MGASHLLNVKSRFKHLMEPLLNIMLLGKTIYFHSASFHVGISECLIGD